MEFGVFDHLDKRNGAYIETIYQERLKLIVEYENSGIAYYHLAEHHATPLGLSPSPSVFLGAISQLTKHLKFGPMVYCLPLYDPLRLISEICMLDQLSKGRFEFGIGRGISPYEVAYFNINIDNNREIYNEVFEILMLGLKNSELNFNGKYFSYNSVPMILKPKQHPHPPLWYGIGAPQGVKWPAENGINIISNASCEIARESTDLYKDIWRANFEEDKTLPKMGVARHIYIGQNDLEANKICQRAYEAWYNNFMNLWTKNNVNPDVYPPDYKDAVKKDIVIAGKPETVTNEIKRQIDKAGLNYFVCRFAFGDLSYEESLSSLSLFRESVLPNFR
mgnify:FL=1